jgi:REP element-mobilizing transposase RayT
LSLKYHLVRCPEYRRKALTAPVDVRLKALLKQKPTLHQRLEVVSNHVRTFVKNLRLAKTVNGLKRRSPTIRVVNL